VPAFFADHAPVRFVLQSTFELVKFTVITTSLCAAQLPLHEITLLPPGFTVLFQVPVTVDEKPVNVDLATRPLSGEFEKVLIQNYLIRTGPVLNKYKLF
jgi:hypothetical protein